MPTYVPSGPSTAPPPRPGAPPVLKWTIAFVLFFMVAGLVAYGFFIVRVIEHFQTGSRERIAAVQPRFAGPDPWIPDIGASGRRNRYRMEVAGFEVELPAIPRTDRSPYTADEAADVASFFNYEVDPREGTFGYVQGLHTRYVDEPTLNHAADVFEYGFEDSSEYEGATFQRRTVRIGGREVLRISGTYRFYRERWYVEGIAFARGPYTVSIGASRQSKEGLASMIDRIQASLEWFEPRVIPL